jgi:transcriptional regulator with XRE-family HTH domain
MKFSNEEVRKSIEETAPIFQAVRRADIALQIRSKMLGKGLKNRDIADRLGVSEANVSRWLRGNQNLSIDTIYQLTDAIEESFQLVIGSAAAVDADQSALLDYVQGTNWSDQQKVKVTGDASACDAGDRRPHSGAVHNLDAYRFARTRVNPPSQHDFSASMSNLGISIC